jgi:hypothetical protein
MSSTESCVVRRRCAACSSRRSCTNPIGDLQAGRNAHLEGRIAQALMGKADELLASRPDLRMADVLAAK